MSDNTPRITRSITKLVEAILKGKAFPMSAEIVSFDGGTRRAKVQPTQRMKMTTGSYKTRAMVPNVPVMFFATGLMEVTSSPQKGDQCTLVCFGRSLDEVKTQDGVQDLKDGRVLNVTDCICILGDLSDTIIKGKRAVDDSLWMGRQDGACGLEVTPQNKVAIGTPTVELIDRITAAIDLMSGLATDLSTALVAVTAPATPAPFNPAAVALFEAKAQQLNAIKLQLEQIKK